MVRPLLPQGRRRNIGRAERARQTEAVDIVVAARGRRAQPRDRRQLARARQPRSALLHVIDALATDLIQVRFEPVQITRILVVGGIRACGVLARAARPERQGGIWIVGLVHRALMRSRRRQWRLVLVLGVIGRMRFGRMLPWRLWRFGRTIGGAACGGLAFRRGTVPHFFRRVIRHTDRIERSSCWGTHLRIPPTLTRFHVILHPFERPCLVSDDA